jgi:hypothetical protein
VLRLAQDPRFRGDKGSFSNLDLQKQAAASDASPLPARSAPAPEAIEEVFSMKSSMGDPLDQIAQNHIPVSEKMKWAAGSSPIFPVDCNEASFNAFNANSATSHHLTVDGRQDSRGYGRHRIGQLRSDALEVEEDGWAVVRPRH